MIRNDAKDAEVAKGRNKRMIESFASLRFSPVSIAPEWKDAR
jgi:hypothetical protein